MKKAGGPGEEEIFAEVVQLPKEQQAACLDRHCAHDPALRQRIERLLGALDRAVPLLKEPPAFAGTVGLHVSPAEKAGDRIGRYKLLEKMGEGGCGVVYMAEQEEPVRRRVALKVIKLGMDTKQVIARFEAERQALALMDHPNIAKVFDAGATETGRPYFVMELVRGIRITDYCEQNCIAHRERLDIFTQVCRAIQHAHQKGIIHRDIKPSNILVTSNDGIPVPKVIDFGIAKATQGRLTGQTVFTAFEQFIGTPAYMSPEQAQLTMQDIDTRSDIYSLGVLLYELLTGTTPFDAETLLAKGLDEMRRTIREVEPVKPSTRITQELVAADVRRLSSKSDTRDLKPEEKVKAFSPRLLQEVKGDLDWIVMKCLEKDRGRRYETASGLAADIQRHLSYEPIVARPPSKLYEFQKTFQRHKFGFVTTAAVILALTVALAVSTSMYWEAQAEKKNAQAEKRKAQTAAARSEQVANFMVEMLNGAGPSVARGRDATVLREILDAAAARVGKELKDEPEVQGDLWFAIAKTYSDIGDNKRAVTNYQHAVDSYRKRFSSAQSRLASALVLLGRHQSSDFNLSQGRTNAASGLDMARKLGDQEVLAKCLAWAADSYDPWFIPEEGAGLLREAIALRKQLGTNEENVIALAESMLALSRSRACERAEKESMGREALTLFREHLGNDDPKTIKAAYVHGQHLRSNGNFEQAELILQDVVNLFSKLYDRKYVHRSIAARFLAETMIAQDKWAQAEDLANQAQDWQLLGSINAWHGEWARAAQQFSHAGATNFMAIALRNLGEDRQYSQLRRDFLDHALASRDIGVEPSARPFLLLPVPSEDLKRLQQFAELAVPSNLPVWLASSFCLTTAMTEYRLGHFDAAAASATNALTFAAHTHSATEAQSWFIQALAFGRMRQMQSARAAFAKGDDLVARFSRDTRDDFLVSWYDWAINESLSREAKELIEK